jgi:hypothetical protein
MKGLGIGPERIVACLATYDYNLLMAAGLRSALEEFPASLHLAGPNIMLRKSFASCLSSQFHAMCQRCRSGFQATANI